MKYASIKYKKVNKYYNTRPLVQKHIKLFINQLDKITTGE